MNIKSKKFLCAVNDDGLQQTKTAYIIQLRHK